MTFLHNKYEFEIEENKVYQLNANRFTNAPKQIHISGTGTVDLASCIETPTTLNDPILTIAEGDSDLFSFYSMNEINYIKLTENQVGVRKIVLSGFDIKIIFE